MATVYEIPTQPNPTTQRITLNGVTYTLTLTWNEFAGPAGAWVLDIADANNNPIASGLPLVTGADLLAQFEYLGIGGGGGLVVQSDHDPDLVPSFTTLGSTGHLFFVSPT